MGNIEIFEQMAGQYDTGERLRVARIIADAVRGQVGDAGGSKSALDYGCGTGLVGLELVDLFGSMLLIDAAEQMVRLTRRKIEAAGLRTARAMCCDLMSEDAPELHVDFVILAQVLLHIQDAPSMLSRLFALLNEGGRLLIVDFDKAENIVSDKVHNGFDQDELIRLCKAAGFSEAGAETFYHGQNLFMGQDASLFLLDAAK